MTNTEYCNLENEWCDYCSVESVCCEELLCDICILSDPSDKIN
jgi:hypothetical protein